MAKRIRPNLLQIVLEPDLKQELDARFQKKGDKSAMVNQALREFFANHSA